VLLRLRPAALTAGQPPVALRRASQGLPATACQCDLSHGHGAASEWAGDGRATGGGRGRLVSQLPVTASHGPGPGRSPRGDSRALAPRLTLHRSANYRATCVGFHAPRRAARAQGQCALGAVGGGSGCQQTIDSSSLDLSEAGRRRRRSPERGCCCSGVELLRRRDPGHSGLRDGRRWPGALGRGRGRWRRRDC
jgi:hypothetical protein